MKKILLPENYYSPDELIDQINLFIDYYNNQRYHKAYFPRIWNKSFFEFNIR